MTSTELGFAVPDKLSIWPVEGGLFGLDATFTGATGYTRAGHHERLLTDAGVKHSFRQELGDAWSIRLGPIEATAVVHAINAFIGPTGP